MTKEQKYERDFTIALQSYIRKNYPVHYVLGFFIGPWTFLCLILGTFLLETHVLGPICVLGIFAISFFLGTISVGLMICLHYKNYEAKRKPRLRRTVTQKKI